MSERVKDTAARLTDFATELSRELQEEESPEHIAQAMVYAAAHLVAFSILHAEKQPGANSRDEQVGAWANRFHEYLLIHLSLYPVDEQGPRPANEELRSIAPDKEILEGLDFISGAAEHSDVALVAYLRGSGKNQLADSLVWRAKERKSPDGDIVYAKRVQAAMESGELEQALAIFVLSPILQPRMMRELDSSGRGLGDPVADGEARQKRAQFYARHGLHKLSTMIRKDPRRYASLDAEGGRLVIGDRFGELRQAIDRFNAKRAH